jgi:hypothetical protein
VWLTAAIVFCESFVGEGVGWVLCRPCCVNPFDGVHSQRPGVDRAAHKAPRRPTDARADARARERHLPGPTEADGDDADDEEEPKPELDKAREVPESLHWCASCLVHSH